MMAHKRSPVSVEQGSLSSLTPKRHKADDHMSFSSKERKEKEKVGERVAALQQLVSPFGKTDTASVLLEAMEYISFLHEQVKVLSAPYLYTTTSPSNIKGSESYNLRSKGLCLVPISCTNGVGSSNGADLWAPIKNSSPKF